VANLAQSPDVVEASIGDLVDVVLHGQLHCPGRHLLPRSRTTTSHSIRPTDLNWSKALWYSGQVDAWTEPDELGFRRVELKP